MRYFPRSFFVLGSLSWLGLALLAGGCAGGVTGDALFPGPADYEVGGIDVSKYQGDIDWSSVHAAGVRFAWIKATEGGDRVDEKFAQNWASAKAAGVPRGAYHFAYWCRPMQEQAAWFSRNVPNDPDALPPVLDVEWNGQSKTCPKRIPRDVAIAQMKIMLAAMEQAYGKKPVIYTSIDFHRDVMEGEFSDYPIWVRSVKCHPSLKYGNRHWHFWQHTAEGHVAAMPSTVRSRIGRLGSPTTKRLPTTKRPARAALDRNKIRRSQARADLGAQPLLMGSFFLRF